MPRSSIGPGVPPDRWHLHQVSYLTPKDRTERPVWTYEVDAENADQAELRVMKALSYDYDDPFTDYHFSANSDPTTPGRFRVAMASPSEEEDC